MSEEVISFSVVIPLYNKESTVERSIRSVLRQSVQDFEIIVVNDGSTDNGTLIVESIKDSRIRLIHQANQGVSAARNRGIIEAKHEFIAFLDADDEWLPEFLKRIRRMVDRFPECDLYATRYYFDSSSRRRSAIVRGLPDDFEGIIGNYFNIALNSNPPVWSSATCVRKSVLAKIGGFPVGVKSGEDLLTWARIASRYPVAYSMDCLSVFYQSPSEFSEGRPTRVPAHDNIVGNGLAELQNIVDKDARPFLCRYCALWHKMRASCYLRLDMRSEARHEIVKALHYDVRLILIIYLILSFLPSSIIRKAFSFGSSN
ncbi:MAG: glycosyl transferase [Deltaproteobacteria bacterium HGW-Deltaproteobacteria-2]|jgi:cellulose synthase/poly-beta-1,6-N-acetylglucosamine synthase-like glycosyltransferase|nr:MAG: glycosyl transferase [Deltaproteobacteria bacterium HGW-Deltaproteobacteria-2]